MEKLKGTEKEFKILKTLEKGEERRDFNSLYNTLKRHLGKFGKFIEEDLKNQNDLLSMKYNINVEELLISVDLPRIFLKECIKYSYEANYGFDVVLKLLPSIKECKSYYDGFYDKIYKMLSSYSQPVGFENKSYEYYKELEKKSLYDSKLLEYILATLEFSQKIKGKVAQYFDDYLKENVYIKEEYYKISKEEYLEKESA